MEIPSLGSYQVAPQNAEPDSQISENQETAQGQKTSTTQESAAEDRVELVRAQNLASPRPEHVDLKKAVNLLRQVTHQLQLVERKEMQQLYQFDRLRDLCCRIHDQPEA